MHCLTLSKLPAVRIFVVWPLCLAFFASTNQAWAQQSTDLTALYGRGVHAFFANRISDAEQHFTQVIQAGSTDPRVFYFRAILRLQSGNRAEAEQDLRIGAAYEANNPGSRESISRSLQRVQGSARRLLERYRRDARLQRVSVRRQQARARYEQLKQRETEVLRRKVELPLNQLIQPTAAQTAPATPAFAEQPTPQPAATTPEAEAAPHAMEDDAFDDLFGEPTPSATPAEATEPMSQPSLVPDAVPSAAEPGDEPAATEAAEDPFGAADLPKSEESGSSIPPAASVAASSKMKPGTLFGVLGRVVGRTIPWRGVRMPTPGPSRFSQSDNAQMGHEGTPATLAEDAPFEFGPPASEETQGSTDDLFGDSSGASEWTDDDPFAPSGAAEADEPSAEAAASAEEETGENAGENTGESESETAVEDDPFSSDDDPFGDF